MLSVLWNKQGSSESVVRRLEGALGRLVVGVRKGQRASQGKFGGTPMLLSDLIRLLEFGNPDNRLPNTDKGHAAPIPARPTLTTLWATSGRKYRNRFRYLTLKHLANGTNPRSEMLAFGRDVRKDVRQAYRAMGRAIMNSRVTVKLKTGRTTFVDTGALMRSGEVEWLPNSTSKSDLRSAAKGLDAARGKRG